MNERISGLTVVVPTLNEAETIETFLERLGEALVELRSAKEVIVVDDASSDGTADLVEGVSRNWSLPLRVLRRVGKPSLSLSVVEGAGAARYSTTCVLDADLSHDPRDLVRIASRVLSLEAQVAVGSRYAAGGEVSEWPITRRILSGVGTRLSRLLTKVNDPLSGYFASRTELLSGESGQLHPRGYKILLELLCRYRGLRVVEVPIGFRDRVGGESKFGLRQGVEFLTQVVALSFAKARSAPEVGTKAGERSVPSISFETMNRETAR